MERLSGLYDGKLILDGNTGRQRDGWGQIYTYDLKTKNLRKRLNDWETKFVWNQYLVTMRTTTGVITDLPLGVYDLTNFKRRSLIRNVWDVCQSGSKFYYIKTAGGS